MQLYSNVFLTYYGQYYQAVTFTFHNPLSCHYPPAFFNPLYYEAFDDSRYHSDDEEDEAINSGDLPSPLRSPLYNNGIGNENIAALISRYLHLLTALQSCHPFTFF